MDDASVIFIALLAAAYLGLRAFLDWRLAMFKEQVLVTNMANLLTVMNKAITFEESGPTVH